MEDQLAAQRAYLLDRILQSTGGKSARSTVFGAKKELKNVGFEGERPQEILNQLVADGHVTEFKRGKSASYQITDQGVAYRKTLPANSEDKDEANDALKGYRQAFCLMQLFMAENYTLQKGEANRFPGLVKADLEMDANKANRLRASLTEQGYVEEVKSGQARIYRLTPSGRMLVATLDQHPSLLFNLTGKKLADFRSAIRESGEFADPLRAEVKSQALPLDLSEAVFEAFLYLHRERYSYTRLVPIYAVRRRIAELYGNEAARHDILDNRILDLWRQGRVRIIPISDLRDSTEDQRADSIGDSSQTLFYMESSHG